MDVSLFAKQYNFGLLFRYQDISFSDEKVLVGIF